ncbi:MAG: hypothetical protein AAB578_04075 [Elusimicrobiota bacterium]
MKAQAAEESERAVTVMEPIRNEPASGLSAPVAAALDEALALVESLAR